MKKKISCLMYADDSVLLPTSDKGLQTFLNFLCSYLMKWNLVLNTDKTQAIDFNKGCKLLNKFHFYYNNCQLAVVSQYKYFNSLLWKNRF